MSRPQQQTWMRKTHHTQDCQHSMQAFKEEIGIHSAVQLHKAPQQRLALLGVGRLLKQRINSRRLLG